MPGLKKVSKGYKRRRFLKTKCGLRFEKKFRQKGYRWIIGIDEAGRGPLAGPVVAAAVALLKDSFNNRIDDSKKLTVRQRENAYLEIIRKSVFGIGIVNEKIIDRLNILQATSLAMEEAVGAVVSKLRINAPKGAHLLIDGMVRPRTDLSFTNIVKGDGRSKSIASASILAKVTRDRIMYLYDKAYPQYGFWRHKGYPTAAHIRALRDFGPCFIHRTTFKRV